MAPQRSGAAGLTGGRERDRLGTRIADQRGLVSSADVDITKIHVESRALRGVLQALQTHRTGRSECCESSGCRSSSVACGWSTPKRRCGESTSAWT